MRKVILAGAAALAVSLGATMRADAFVCVNCTQELGEWMREAKRAVEFAKHLAVVKESFDYHVRSWQALYHARDFGSLLYALNGLSWRYYPEAGEVVNLMQAGRSIGNGSMFNSYAMGRLERGLGNGAEFVEEFERSRTLNATARTILVNAMRGSQHSALQIEQAVARLNGAQGQANLTAAGNALQGATATQAAHVNQGLLLQSIIREEREAEQLRREEFQRIQARRYAQELAANGSGRISEVYR